MSLDFVIDFEKTQIWVNGVLSVEGPGVKLDFYTDIPFGFFTALGTTASPFFIPFSAQNTAQTISLSLTNLKRWDFALNEEEINYLFGD